MKRIFVLIFILMFASGNVMQVHAEAATITVASGALATGGLSTAGFAGLLTPVAVIVGVGLLACGVDVALTNASQQAGMTKTDFIKSKITQFCNATSKTVGEFCKTILEGVTIAKNGAIQLSNQAAAQIKQLGEWLFANNEVSNPTTITGSSVTLHSNTYGNVTLPLVTSISITFSSNGETYSTTWDRPVAVYLKKVSSTLYNVNIISNSRFVVTQAPSRQMFSYKSGNGEEVTSTNYYINTSVDETLTHIGGYDNIPILDIPSSLSTAGFARTLDGTWNDNAAVDTPADSFTGSRDDWASGSNALDPAQDKTTVLNPGLVQGLDIPGVNDLTTTVQDYLDALQEALDKANDIELPAIDTITGERVNVGVNESTFDPAIDKEDNQDLPQDNTPVSDPSVPATGDLPINQNTIQLKNFFPFCLPYDFVDMVRMLRAEPVAPNFTWSFRVPMVNQTVSIPVDLSGYNSVATLFRRMELLLFCIGLAIATRSIFIRG